MDQETKMDLRPKLDKMDHVNLYLFFILYLYQCSLKLFFRVWKPDLGFSTRVGPDPAGFSRINPVWFQSGENNFRTNLAGFRTGFEFFPEFSSTSFTSGRVPIFPLVAAESTNCQFAEMFWLGIHFVAIHFVLDPVCPVLAEDPFCIGAIITPTHLYK